MGSSAARAHPISGHPVPQFGLGREPGTGIEPIPRHLGQSLSPSREGTFSQHSVNQQSSSSYTRKMAFSSSSISSSSMLNGTATVESLEPSPELLQQIQLGFNAFWLMQRLATGDVNGQSSYGYGGGGGGIFPTLSPSLFQQHFAAFTAPNNTAIVPTEQQHQQEQQEQLQEMSPSPMPESPKAVKKQAKLVVAAGAVVINKNGEEKGKDKQIDVGAKEDEKLYVRPPVLDKRWEFVQAVASFAEFEHLRCLHQVSRNRTFAYGIRYSCTQKTQLRSNCPYLLVCIFADGAGEATPPGLGTITVYARNAHTHPVKAIKRRLPRSLARQAKREREEAAEQLKKAASDAMEEKEGKPTPTTELLVVEDEDDDDEVEVIGTVSATAAIAATSCGDSSNKNTPAVDCKPLGSSSAIQGQQQQHDKLMDLLAELAQHFAAPLQQQVERNETD